MTTNNVLSNYGILNKKEDNLALREVKILERIKKHYSTKLGRTVDESEAQEIAANLLNFAKAIYGA